MKVTWAGNCDICNATATKRLIGMGENQNLYLCENCYKAYMRGLKDASALLDQTTALIESHN